MVVVGDVTVELIKMYAERKGAEGLTKALGRMGGNGNERERIHSLFKVFDKILIEGHVKRTRGFKLVKFKQL